MAVTSLRVLSPDGTIVRGDRRDYLDLSYVLSVGQVGALEVTFPRDAVDLSQFSDYTRLQAWRSVSGRPARLDGEATWLIRGLAFDEDAGTVTFTAYHANYLLGSRAILFFSTLFAGEANKTGFAGDLIKQYAREQLGALTGSTAVDRAYFGATTNQSIAAYLSVAADAGDGISLSKNAMLRNLLTTCQELAQASTQSGTYLTFDVVTTDGAGLELRTYAGQRGVDRRASSGQPLILSRSRGNLAQGSYRLDSSTEATYVQVAGSGPDQGYKYIGVIDAVRSSATPFSRREITISGPSGADALYQADGNAALRANRPRQSASGVLVETDSAIRGVHFDYGDYVTCEIAGYTFDCRLDTIRVRVTPDGDTQTIQLRVEA